MFDTVQAITGWEMGVPDSLALTPRTAGGLRSLKSTQARETGTLGYNIFHQKPRSAALWSEWQEMY